MKRRSLCLALSILVCATCVFPVILADTQARNRGLQVKRRENPELVVQNGHTDTIRAVAFSPGGQILASASADKTIKIWDPASGALIRTIQAHKDNVTSLSFSPDGRLLASGSLDRTIKLWDAISGLMVRGFDAAPSSVTALAYSRDGRSIAAGYEDGRIIRWDVRTGAQISVLDAHPGGVRCIAFRPAGDTMASGGADGTLNIWAANGDAPLKSLKGHTGSVTSLAFSPDGSRLVSGDWGKTVRVWDAQTGELIGARAAHAGDISAVAYSPSGKTFASASTDGTIKIWDSGSLAPYRTIQNGGGVSSIAYGPGGDRIASGDARALKIWDVASGTNLYTMSGGSSAVRAVAFSPDGKTLATCSLNEIGLWDAETGNLVKVFHSGGGRVFYSLAFSPLGNLLASGGSDSVVDLWNLKTGTLLRRLRGHTGPILSLAFSPDGRMLASGSEDHSVRLWNPANGRSLKVLSGHYSLVEAVAFSPDGRFLASGGADNAIKLWDATTGAQLHGFEGHESEIRGLAFSPDGARLASASADKTVRLWDRTSGSQLAVLTGHESDVQCVAFSPDGRSLGSGGWDKTIKIWDTGTGTLIKTLAGHSAQVNSLAFSPDGKLLASGSSDTTAAVWSSDGQLLATFLVFDNGNWIDFTPDGYYSGTERAPGYVAWRIGIKVYAFDEFFDRYYKPEAVSAALQSRKVESKQPAVFDQFAPPPEVRIVAPEVPDGATEAAVTVEVKDNGGGIGEVRLYDNGKIISGGSRGIFVKKTAKYAYTVPLIEGDNILEATAFNSDRTESAPYKLVIKSGAPEKQASLHLVVIGLNKYENSALDLNFAGPDAKSIAAFFNDNGRRLFRAINVYSLYDDKATKKNILQTFAEVRQKAQPEDVVVVFMAGHGDTRNGEWYFVPYEVTRPETDQDVIQNGLSSSSLSKELGSVRSQKVLLLVDACKAGSLLVAFRGFEERKALAQLARATGIHILAASTKDQNAEEVQSLGHGLFTYLVLKGLGGDAVLKSSGKEVTVYGLISYVQDAMPELSRKYQTEAQYPVSDSRGMDFPLNLIP